MKKLLNVLKFRDLRLGERFDLRTESRVALGLLKVSERQAATGGEPALIKVKPTQEVIVR